MMNLSAEAQILGLGGGVRTPCAGSDAPLNKLPSKALQSADNQSGLWVTSIAHNSGGMGVGTWYADGHSSRKTCM